MSATVHRYRRFTLWPVLDDDGRVEYWDIYEPCRFGCESKWYPRADGTLERGKCDCTDESVSAATASTLADAKRAVVVLERELRSDAALEALLEGKRVRPRR